MYMPTEYHMPTSSVKTPTETVSAYAFGDSPRGPMAGFSGVSDDFEAPKPPDFALRLSNASWTARNADLACLKVAMNRDDLFI